MNKLVTTTALALCLATGAVAQEKTDFRVAWSIYVGWMPWGYLEDSGIMDKWVVSRKWWNFCGSVLRAV